jgi:hypothetical protein
VGTTTTDISEERKTYNVFLSKAVYEILEVSVESESLIREREKCLKIFRKEFLGSSSNAKNSFIMNEEVITFNYQSNKDTLKAIARKPLIIVNHALGYQITYYLGSCKHFFSTLWADNLRAEGFFVQRVGTAEPLKQLEFVLQDARGNKYFYFLEDLEIAYDHHHSTVSFLKPWTRFEKDGFFEPEAILWYNYMAMARKADWLPYEYAPAN